MAVAIDTPNQGRVAASVNGTTTFTTLATVPAAGTLVVIMGIFRATATTHTVSGGGLTWAQVGSTVVSGSLRISLWYAHCPSGLASGTTITVGGSAGTNDITAVASSFTGIATTSTITAFNNNSASTAAWGGASVAASSGDALIGGAWGDGTLRTSTATSPAVEANDFNSATTSGSVTLAYKTSVSGSDSVAGTWSGTLGHLHIAGAFAAAAGGATTHERSAAIAATGAITVANREFYSIFARSATLDATAAVTVAAREFYTTFQRSAALDATGLIAAVPEAVTPVNRTAPAVTGTPHIGQTLTCSTGQWSATPPATYSYQWYTGGSAFYPVGEGFTYTTIPGATASTYAPTSAGTYFCAVTATNVNGFTSKASNDVTVILMARSATLDAAGTITVADHERDHVRQVTLDATAAIQATGQIVGQATTHERAATLTATGTITATGQRDLQRAAALTAAAAIAAAGLRVHQRQATVTATAALTVAHQRELQRQAALTALAAIAAGHQRDHHRQVTLTAVGLIDTSGTIGEIPPLPEIPATGHARAPRTGQAHTPTVGHARTPTVGQARKTAVTV